MSPALGLEDAMKRLRSLRYRLSQMSSGDQEQEVQGMGLQVSDAVLNAAREWVPQGDPVIDRIQEVISVENIESGEPVRAVDLLIVVDQTMDALSNVKAQKAHQPIDLHTEAGPFDTY
jgi:hypothetical protein